MENPDRAWNSFSPEEVTAVEPAPQRVDAFTIVDVENPNGLLERSAGSDGASIPDTGAGDVKLTLRWNSSSDLDLHVLEPSGEELWYSAKGPSATGGRLDIDANIGCEEDGSLENIFWPLGKAPTGQYTVKVVGYSVTGCGSGDYELTIAVAGKEPRVINGTVGEDEEDLYDFSSSGVGDFFDPAEQETVTGVQCPADFPAGEQTTEDGITGYDRDASLFEVQCNGLGAGTVEYTLGMRCALFAAGASVSGDEGPADVTSALCDDPPPFRTSNRATGSPAAARRHAATSALSSRVRPTPSPPARPHRMIRELLRWARTPTAHCTPRRRPAAQVAPRTAVSVSKPSARTRPRGPLQRSLPEL